MTMKNQNHLSLRLQSLLAPALTGFLALIIYVITLAPDLTWANYGSDGGELITASITSGIPHPPGYPTYVLLGKLAGWLPVGTVAWRFNLFSAVSAATAVAFLTATAQNVLKDVKSREAVAIACGLTIAFTPIFWGQALITEVYALNIAILAILLWSLLSGFSPLLSGVLLGLAITTHLSSLIMLPLALFLTPRSRWYPLFGGLMLGLLPYLTLPFLARSGSPVLWGDPSSLGGWLWLVSGRIYHANLRPPEISALFPRILLLGTSLLRQWLWAGWLIVVLGMTTRLLERRQILALAATSLIYLIYGIFYQTEDVIVNLLPILLLLSPLMAAGFSRIGAWSLILPILLLLLNFQALNLRQDRSVRPLAETVLNSAPQKAILLTPGDQSIFTLWYFHHVEGIREDLLLVDANLFAFDWYRKHLNTFYPELAGLEKDDLEAFRISNGLVRPICDVPADLAGAATCMPRSETP
jgi:hypothetical protein